MTESTPLNTAENTVLLIVDMQEKLAPAIAGIEDIVANVSRLMRAAAILDVPIVFTEHYVKGLGPTVKELSSLAESAAVFGKINFSAMQEQPFYDLMNAIDRDRVIVTGTETHVCVMQTSLELLDCGFLPYVAVDATGSRNDVDKETALSRMREEGIGVVSTEMVLFEWMTRGDTPEFRKILPLIKL